MAAGGTTACETLGTRPLRGALALVSAGLFVSACGGRTDLVVLPQVGQFSEHSAVARDADVRLIVRTDAWTGSALHDVTALQVTIINGRAAPLRIRHDDFALAAPKKRIPATTPPFAACEGLTTPLMNDLARAALVEGVVPPGSRVTGFVYFCELDDVDRVDLVVAVVDAATAAQVGTIDVTLETD